MGDVPGDESSGTVTSLSDWVEDDVVNDRKLNPKGETGGMSPGASDSGKLATRLTFVVTLRVSTGLLDNARF